MYKRDLGVVLLAVFAIFWSLQHEGYYRYYKAFYYDIPQDDRLIEEQHRLPAPVVVCPQCSLTVRPLSVPKRPRQIQQHLGALALIWAVPALQCTSVTLCPTMAICRTPSYKLAAPSRLSRGLWMLCDS